jgi:hypothetical protein
LFEIKIKFFLLELMGERERIVREGVVRGVARADTVPAGLESS